MPIKGDGLVEFVTPVRNTDPGYVTGSKSSSGDNTLIAAQAGVQIVVTALQVQLEASTATLGIIKFGSTAKWRVHMENKGDGLLMIFPRGSEWYLPTNEALVLNLDGANQVGYSVEYHTE